MFLSSPNIGPFKRKPVDRWSDVQETDVPLKMSMNQVTLEKSDRNTQTHTVRMRCTGKQKTSNVLTVLAIPEEHNAQSV